MLLYRLTIKFFFLLKKQKQEEMFVRHCFRYTVGGTFHCPALMGAASPADGPKVDSDAEEKNNKVKR